MNVNTTLEAVEGDSGLEGTANDQPIAESSAAIESANADDNNKKLKEQQKSINYVKLNIYEIGCFFQLAQLFIIAKKSGRGIAISTINESSPETSDTFITDFAVGLGSDFVEFGGIISSDYNCKYNRLVSIQKEMK